MCMCGVAPICDKSNIVAQQRPTSNTLVCVYVVFKTNTTKNLRFRALLSNSEEMPRLNPSSCSLLSSLRKGDGWMDGWE